MVTKKIKYVDYDGNQREEEFLFNLNKAETLMWLTTSGEYTLDKVLIRLATERNGRKIMENFEELIRLSYGKKSLDGRNFEKSDEIWNDFRSTEAYSVLFTELVTNAKKAAEFVNQVIPKDLSEEVNKIMKEHPEGIPDELKDYIPKLEETTSSS